MYSHYKKTYTLKVLIGYAPTGMFTFVSRAFGGRTSHSFITKESSSGEVLTVRAGNGRQGLPY